jgi:hypothetical protein
MESVQEARSREIDCDATKKTKSEAAPVKAGKTYSSGVKQSFAKMDQAKEKCEEIGLTPKTPNFAKCVMRLMD